MTSSPSSTAPPSALTLAPDFLRAAAIGLSFRVQQDADLPFLAALYRSTRESELDRTSWSETEKQAFISMQFDAQRRHYSDYYPTAAWLIIEIATQAVGRLYLDHWQGEHRIIDIALMPQVRGQGFGTAILADLKEDAAR